MQMVLDTFMDGQPVTMEVDTGAAVSIMSKIFFDPGFLKGITADLSSSQDLHFTHMRSCWCLRRYKI